ncbi:MAG: hypothetical protein LBQ20_02920 [Rhodanobacter sp.]|jgi:hypothetical protein|nr:hypothetical protein [Rhodanobacter sp.]
MKPIWHWQDYLRTRRQFVDARQHRASTVGIALVFTVTWLAGWVCSALLHRGGIDNMALRYALSAAVAYAAFFAAVRIWAHFQNAEPSNTGEWLRPLDMLEWNYDGEGCPTALAIFLASLLAATLLAAFGGLAALFEVAFEVVFAGVIVRRAFGEKFILGAWWQLLLRRTWLSALLIATLLVALAAQVQTWYPQDTTLGQAFTHWLRERQ